MTDNSYLAPCSYKSILLTIALRALLKLIGLRPPPEAIGFATARRAIANNKSKKFARLLVRMNLKS